MDEKEWEPSQELADMQLIINGLLGKGGRPVTEYQAKLKAQYDDPKQFEKFQARLERMQTRHDDKIVALTAARAAQEAARNPGEAIVDEGHEKVESRLRELIGGFDAKAELELLSRRSKPKAAPG